MKSLLLLIHLALPLVAQQTSSITLERSTDLRTWDVLPVTPGMLDSNGNIIPVSDVHSYRLQIAMRMSPLAGPPPTSVTLSASKRVSLENSENLRDWRRIALSASMLDSSGKVQLPAPTSKSFYRLRVSDLENVVPPLMSLIPAGSFEMGDVVDGNEFGDAPVVTVYVSAFYIQKYEVTKVLWDEVRVWGLANGYTDLRWGNAKGPSHPVIAITWWDAMKWCNALSEKEGLTPCYTADGTVIRTGETDPTVNWSANGYRFPTEAEWEKAARGGISGQRYPWGSDTISHSQANYDAGGTGYGNLSGNAGYHPTYSISNTPYTSPVGIFPFNGYGLYDMAGNVEEMCWDSYDENAYINGAVDPRGPVESASLKVARGGTWQSYQGSTRVSNREIAITTSAEQDLGLRVARSVTP